MVMITSWVQSLVAKLIGIVFMPILVVLLSQ
jgi:hypothetical protein